MPATDDPYTSEPTHLRIYFESVEDDKPWHIDGADNEGRYTEDVVRFATMADALSYGPQFMEENKHLTWNFDPGRRTRIRPNQK